MKNEAALVAVDSLEMERKKTNIAKRQRRRLVKSEVISPDLVLVDNKLPKENQQHNKIPVKQKLKVDTRPASSQLFKVYSESQSNLCV